MRKRLVGYRWNPATLSHEARCPDCKQLTATITAEYLALMEPGTKAPFFAIHECHALPCTCHLDPYTCPQGLALVQAIHDRKTAQGDQLVRNA